MPTILRIGPYRFHFYSAEGNEPPHIHIERDDLECKFLLQPVTLASNYGFPGAELNKLAELVRLHQIELTQAWQQYHG